MAANTLIQIKRSTTTGVPGSLSLSELAYSYSSNTLFIGNTSGVYNVGGVYYTSQLDSASSANGAGTLVKRTANGDIAIRDLTANSINGTFVGTLQTTGVSAGQYGNATTIATFTVGSDGRLTSAANVAVSAIFAEANAFVQFTTDSSGEDVVADLFNDIVTIKGANGISILSNAATDRINVALNATTVTQGTYGGYGDANNNNLAFFTVDAQGRLTSAGNVLIKNTTTMAASVNAYATLVGTSGNTYATSVGTSGNNWATATFVKLSSATQQVIASDIAISGNLIISGQTAYQNVSTIKVTDPLIYLASNNYYSDMVDIGFIANYSNGALANLHTGLARDSGTKEYYLFTAYKGEPDEANNQLDFSNVANQYFEYATLNANLKSNNIIYQGQQLSAYISSIANNASLNVSNVTAGVLGVGYGGTGTTTLTNNYVLLGNGTSAIKSVGSTTEGHVLKISNAGIPEFGMLDGGSF